MNDAADRVGVNAFPTDDLPDVLFGHLKLKDARQALRNIASSGSKYLLTTTFTARTANEELGLIFFRPLNLQKPPFSLPEPIEIISEECTENDGAFSDKSLALWRIEDIRTQVLR